MKKNMFLGGLAVLVLGLTTVAVTAQLFTPFDWFKWGSDDAATEEISAEPAVEVQDFSKEHGIGNMTPMELGDYESPDGVPYRIISDEEFEAFNRQIQEAYEADPESVFIQDGQGEYHEISNTFAAAAEANANAEKFADRPEKKDGKTDSKAASKGGSKAASVKASVYASYRATSVNMSRKASFRATSKKYSVTTSVRASKASNAACENQVTQGNIFVGNVPGNLPPGSPHAPNLGVVEALCASGGAPALCPEGCKDCGVTTGTYGISCTRHGTAARPDGDTKSSVKPAPVWLWDCVALCQSTRVCKA